MNNFTQQDLDTFKKETKTYLKHCIDYEVRFENSDFHLNGWWDFHVNFGLISHKGSMILKYRLKDLEDEIIGLVNKELFNKKFNKMLNE